MISMQAIADEAYALIVTMKADNGVYGYLLSDAPEVTCGGTEFWVNTKREALEVTRSDVSKYSYEKVFTLNDTLTNQSVVTGDYTAAIIIRTLTPNVWNTLCLPFDLSAGEVTEFFGSDTQLREYTGYDVESGTFKFKRVSSIQAGVAYLVKPTQMTTDYKKQLFVPAVTVTAAVPATGVKDGYGFQGIYQPYALNEDGSHLFLIASGKLVKPATGKNTLKGMRAYFVAPSTADAKLFTLDFDSEDIDPTGIKTITPNAPTTTKVYSLSGQYMGDKTQLLPKGIYIMNGRKVAVK